ncbi:MAG: hypothetical protein ACLPLR_17605 [Terriglobales bacterium]
MKCCDVERVLPEFLDPEPDGAFEARRSEIVPSERTLEMRPAAADVEAHLKSCAACSELVSELKLVSSQAQQLAASEEPPSRVWVRIAAELRAEGLISQSAPLRPILVPTSAPRRWSPWWLAPVAAGLVAAGAYVVSHRPAPQVAQQTPATPVTNAAATPSQVPVPVPSPLPKAAAATSPAVPAPAGQQVAQKESKPSGMPETAADQPVATLPGDEDQRSEDQQFLSVVSTLAPSARATYESELQAVNADIRETQAYVNRNPGDEDARQHLMDAYQQKALLYQIALDRIQ